MFKPVSAINNKFVVESVSGSPDFNYRLQKVLSFYHEDFKLDKEGNILILDSKWKDQDLMWNYTNKANDPQWMKDNIK
jgi:hypothetical protein